MASQPESSHHASTLRKHKQIYDRYQDLIREARIKLNSPPQMVYTTYFYQILSEESGYGISYISTIINRERRRRETEDRQATEQAPERSDKPQTVTKE